MFNEVLGIILIFGLTFILAYPLGKYIARIIRNEKTFPGFLTKIENYILKKAGINPDEEYDWKKNLKALLWIHVIWFALTFMILCYQSYIPFLNQGNVISIEPVLAFNIVSSFITNTNLQHYSGESNLTNFSQIFVVMFLQFVSAGVGIASAAILIKLLKGNSGKYAGNFYVLFIKSCTRILLPLSILLSIILILNGSPMKFSGPDKINSLEDNATLVPGGPIAALVAIKQLGTNGGGFFNANSAHPFENPNVLTNIIESISIALIPISMIFAMGFYLNPKKLAWIILFVMTVGFLLLLLPVIYFEMNGNPVISSYGINQVLGNMEGKEIRFGSLYSSYWAIITTVTSSGSINAVHSSFIPISGVFIMLGMMLNSLYGGVGVGFINMFTFIIITVFISGLMVGRTPEFLGKKIEKREIKIAALVLLLHPLLILGGTALSSYVMYTTMGGNDTLKWINNPGFHGFSEMLYEFTSAAANNGSSFSNNGNNFFWNFTSAIVMLLGRFIPIIGPITIGGILSEKKSVPPSSGTLRIDSAVFGIILFSIIIIVGALMFLPALVLGPISEQLTLLK